MRLRLSKNHLQMPFERRYNRLGGGINVVGFNIYPVDVKEFISYLHGHSAGGKRDGISQDSSANAAFKFGTNLHDARVNRQGGRA